MALDSRNRRASALACGLAFLAVLPAPGSGIAQPERQQAAYVYAGILAAAPPVGEPSILDLFASYAPHLELAGSVGEPVEASASFDAVLDLDASQGTV